MVAFHNAAYAILRFAPAASPPPAQSPPRLSAAGKSSPSQRLGRRPALQGQGAFRGRCMDSYRDREGGKGQVRRPRSRENRAASRTGHGRCGEGDKAREREHANRTQLDTCQRSLGVHASAETGTPTWTEAEANASKQPSTPHTLPLYPNMHMPRGNYTYVLCCLFFVLLYS